MKKLLQQIMFIGCLLFGGIQLQAQATLSVQGTLQNFDGTAVDNGQYDITFKLYTTDAGGTPIWTEVQSVNLIGGVYSVLLGATTPLNAPFDQTYYLGLTIPGGPEHTPRALMTASPYALSVIGEDNQFPSTGIVSMDAIATEERTTVAPTVAVDAKDHVIFLDHTANQNITLPAASASEGRHLMLVNKAAVAKTLTASNYLAITNATATTIPGNSVIELQSDGSVWRQTGGYVTPVASAKAYVLASRGTLGGASYISAGAWTTIIWAEDSDEQNAFAANTFTAPRTGYYRVAGSTGGDINTLVGSLPSSTTRISIRCQGTCALGVANKVIAYSELDGKPGYSLYGINFSTDVYMTAGQTLFLQINVAAPLSGTFDSHLTILEQ
jgi:hypothetical protein